MIIPMLCVTIFVILVVWFLLPRVARLMIHTPTAISIFVCLSMVQLMAVFISMRCTLCGHFLQVALTLILVVGYATLVQLAALSVGVVLGILVGELLVCASGEVGIEYLASRVDSGLLVGRCISAGAVFRTVFVASLRSWSEKFTRSLTTTVTA